MADGPIAKSLTVQELGRRGGKARMVKMTPEERRRVAQMGARARWHKKAESPEPPTTPPDPNGPQRDRQWAEAGIMSTRRPVASVESSKTSEPRSHAHAA